MLETAKKTENTLYKELDFFCGLGEGGVGILDFSKGVNPVMLSQKSFVLICCLINRVRKKIDDV